MNTDRAKEQAAVMIAFSEGKPIEARALPEGDWKQFEEQLGWNWSWFDYRVAPSSAEPGPRAGEVGSVLAWVKSPPLTIEPYESDHDKEEWASEGWTLWRLEAHPPGELPESWTPLRPAEGPWLPPELREFLATIPKLTADELARLEAGVKRIMPEVLAEIEREQPASAARERVVEVPASLVQRLLDAHGQSTVDWPAMRELSALLHPSAPPQARTVPEGWRYFKDRTGSRWRFPAAGDGQHLEGGEWVPSIIDLRVMLNPANVSDDGTIETDPNGTPLP